MFNAYKDHWENVYNTKKKIKLAGFSTPQKSIDLIKSINLDLKSNIIDVGAGDSRL